MDPDFINRFLEKNPLLKKKQSLLESIQPGTFCYHKGWGVGCIQSIHETDNRIQIAFVNHQEPKSMDLAFGLQILQFLPENHLIVEVRKDVNAAQALLRTQPTAWVIKALQSFPEHKASALELETILWQALSPFFKPDRFKRWWVSMQKMLVNDPMICIPKHKNDVYTLREQPISREQELVEALLSEPQSDKKIGIGRQLCQSNAQWDSIRESIPQLLTIMTTLANNSTLSLAQRLEACWIRNDFSHFLDAAAPEPEPTAQSILQTVQDAKKIAACAEKIQHCFQERFFNLLPKSYPHEWQSIALSMIKHGSISLIDTSLQFLWNHEGKDLLQKTLCQWLQEQTLSSHLIIWIIKHRKTPPYDSLVAPLLQVSFLTCIFQRIDQDALNVLPGRRLALAEEINKDTSLIADLLQHTNQAVAADLVHILLHNQGLDDLKKRSLFARFIRVFPELQQLNRKNSGSSEEILFVSEASLEAAKKEYDELVTVKIPAVKQAIAEAREKGDLRENSEYKMAKQDQTVLLSRKSMLEKSIRNARVIQAQEVQTDQVNVGTKVTLKGAKVSHYTILGAWDSDPQKNILSYQTPFAQSMLGKTVGDTITLPDGETVSIQSIQRA